MPVGLSETFPSSTCYRLLALLVLDAPDLCCDGNQLNQVRSLPFDVSCAAFLTPPLPRSLSLLQIDRLTWAEGMRSVLKLEHVPWLHLLPKLCEVEPDGMINYARFLDR